MNFFNTKQKMDLIIKPFIALFLSVAIVACTGGSSDPNATTTFAKVYGGIDNIEYTSVYETDQGYGAILATAQPYKITRLDVDKNGIETIGKRYLNSGELAYDIDKTAILSNGLITADTDVNKMSNSYILSVSKKRYNSNPELLPADEWNDAQQINFSTSYWQSDNSDFDNKPATITDAIASVKVALSTSGLTDIYVKVYEKAFVQSFKFGELSPRERIILYHYTPSGTLLGVKQLSESDNEADTEISVGFDGSYLLSTKNITLTLESRDAKKNEYSTSYDLSFYTKDGGRIWKRTLGPFPSKGTSSAEFRNRGVTKGIVAKIYNYKKDQRSNKVYIRYLSLDANGNNRWDFDLDENAAERVTPLNMACDLTGECLLVAVSPYGAQKLFIWNDSTQATTFDLSATPITIRTRDISNTQLQVWPDNIFRFLVYDYSDYSEYEDYQFQISIGTNGITINYNTQKLSELLGSINLTLTPFGMSIVSNSKYKKMYDTNGSALFEPGEKTDLANYILEPQNISNSLPRFENGLLYVQSSHATGELLKLSDNNQYTKKHNSKNYLGFDRFELQKDGSLLTFNNEGYDELIKKYDSNNSLVWSKYLRDPTNARPELRIQVAEFSNGDTLLVTDIRDQIGYSNQTLIYEFKNYLLMSRITPDGVQVWQRLWDIDELKYTSVDYSHGVVAKEQILNSMVANIIKENDKDIPVVILASNYEPNADFAEDRMFNALSFDENDGKITAVKYMSPVIKESYSNDYKFSADYKLVSTSDGYLWLGFTSNTLTSRDTGVDNEGNPIALPYGADNIALLRLNGKLEVDRLRIYGASDDEKLTDLRVLKDGGLLVGATTKSFRLNDSQSDAWVLRLDADGNIAKGCQALLAKLNGEPAAFHMGEHDGTLLTESNSSAFYYEDETVGPFLLSESTGTINANPKALETARVCLGEITPPPLPEEITPVIDRVDLTVVIEGGPGAGQVMSSETPTPLINCVNSNENTTTCTSEYKRGDTVSLSANAFNNGIISWDGCAESVNQFERPVCNITLDTDKTVTTTFVPTKKLSVTIRNASPSGPSVFSSDSPVSLFCRSTNAADKTCEAYFPKNNLVFLQWNDFGGSGVQSWQGCTPQTTPTVGCLLKMDSDKSVIAIF